MLFVNQNVNVVAVEGNNFYFHDRVPELLVRHQVLKLYASEIYLPSLTACLRKRGFQICNNSRNVLKYFLNTFASEP
jgi:hypothetical protein